MIRKLYIYQEMSCCSRHHFRPKAMSSWFYPKQLGLSTPIYYSLPTLPS